MDSKTWTRKRDQNVIRREFFFITITIAYEFMSDMK